MLDFTAVEKNHELANRLAETFRRQTKKKAAKALFMGVSPLALAACGGGSDSSVAQTLVSGTDGNDTFANSAANERFEGGLGDDTYTVGLTGIDTVFDAGGNDTIKFIWRDAQDVLVENVYSNENDLIVEMVGASNTMNIEGAFAPASRIENVNYYNATGEWGEGFVAKLFKFGEAVEGEGGGHLIVGTNSDDTVAITDGDTDEISLWGANGDDNLTTGSGVQYIWGGNGNDIVDSGSGNDTIWGDDGDDIIYAGDGNDTVYGGAGDDIIYATNGGDFEDGGQGNDTMVILGDNAPAEFIINLETETGGIPGGTIFENAVTNFENLKIGYEWPTGSYVGNNTNWDITGTTEANVLETSEGDDVIKGLSGSDTLIGNGGADTFVFKDGETGTDIIADFDLVEGDKLDLSSYGITTEEAAEALMSDSSDGVNVTIEGSVIVTMTATIVADFAAADGWLAQKRSPTTSLYTPWTNAEVLAHLEQGWGVNAVTDLQLDYLYGSEPEVSGE